MGLQWVRMDTQWPSNPKFLALIADGKWRAIAVYWGALGWSGMHGLDGFVDPICLPAIHATKRNCEELVAARLWQPVEGGWVIPDYREFQLSTEELAERSKKAKMAASVRWHTENGKG